MQKQKNKRTFLLGLKTAIESLDKTIKIVRESKSAQVAKAELIAAFSLDDIQAQAILDMKLQRLTGLERDKLLNDYNKLLALIKDLKDILLSDSKQYSIMTEELELIIEKYGDDRRTEVLDIEDDSDIDMEDLIKPEDCVVTISHAGYVKRVPVDTYRAQGRGGKGIIAAGSKEEDFVEEIFVANTHAYLLCFTNRGQVHWIKVYKVPEGSRQAKGKPIINLLPLQDGEVVTTVIPVKEFKEGEYLALFTKNGVVKKSLLKDYSRPRQGGIKGINLDEGDELIKARLTNGSHEIMIATAHGIASRFSESDMRPMGRVSRGTRGINLEEKDEVIGAILGEENTSILTITENGYGKRTSVEDYRLIRRGGKGVRNIITSERNGDVVAVMAVKDDDEIMVMSKNGIAIRIRAADISKIGRNTQGVRVMRLNDGDKVVSATKIVLDVTE